MNHLACGCLRTVGFLLSIFAFIPALPAAQGAAAKPTVDLRQHPNGGKTPIEVEVGLYIINFVAIDESRESFEVGGFHIARWKDPRLALTPDQLSKLKDEQEKVRSYRLEDLWAPSIEGANEISHHTNQYLLQADETGTVTYRERFDAVLSDDYELKKFPFDTQVLRFSYQPFVSSASEFRFGAKAIPGTGVSKEETTELAAWRIANMTYTAAEVSSDPFAPETHEALFKIVMKRRWGFYVWKIFLPLMMMAMIPAVVFWVDVREFDWLLKIPMTMLLSMVAFGFTISRDLPKTGYLTFMDAVFVVSFAFCFLCMFEISLVYLLQKHGRRPVAVRLHSAGRWAYPGAYFGVLLLLAIGFLA